MKMDSFIRVLDDYFDFSNYILWTEEKESLWYRCTAFSGIMIWLSAVLILPVSLLSGIVKGNIGLPVLDIVVGCALLLPYLFFGPLLYWHGTRGNLNSAYWGGVLMVFFSVGMMSAIFFGLYSTELLACFLGELFMLPSLLASCLFIVRTQCHDYRDFLKGYHVAKLAFYCLCHILPLLCVIQWRSS